MLWCLAAQLAQPSRCFLIERFLQRIDFTVGVRRDQRFRLFAVHCHLQTPFAACKSGEPATGRGRARASDITVPIGMSAMLAISLYESSSISRKISTSR
jgi:hypothetical protein